MEIHYCDLCAQPLKDGQSWILYIASPEDMNRALESKEDVTRYINKVQSEQKEICPTCKHLYDRIFHYRLEGMASLTEECYNLFNLPPYDKKYLPKEGDIQEGRIKKGGVGTKPTTPRPEDPKGEGGKKKGKK